MNRGIYIADLNEKALEFLKSSNFDFIWSNKNPKLKNIKVIYPLGMFGAGSEDEEIKYKAIGKNKKPIETFAGWYKGLCPNNPELREVRLKQIKKIFKNPDFDGICLDAIRYPTYWETKKPEFLDTCYCPFCNKLYKENNLGWMEFRIKQIEEMVKQIADLKKDKLLGYFAVPEPEERLETVFAQPTRIFKDKVDFVSPMIYPQMMGKNNMWVSEIIDFFQKEFGQERVIPIIQLVKMPDNSPDNFSIQDFKKLEAVVKNKGGFGYFMLDQIKGKENIYL